jgi:hypothetical protein
MIEALVTLLILALFLGGLYWICTVAPFMQGWPLQAVSIVCCVIFLIAVLQVLLGMVGHGIGISLPRLC